MGLIKFYLALCVLFSHIGLKVFFPVLDAGMAVNCFFVISGFFISMGLNERYTYKRSNIMFYTSRFLRIWPLYVVSIVILAPWGVLSYQFDLINELPLITRIFIIFSNIFILGIDIPLHFSFLNGNIVNSAFGIDPNHNGVSYIFNLPAWSLSIELIFYGIAPFVVRSLKRSIIFFLIGLSYCLYFKYTNLGFAYSFRIDLLFLGAMFYFGLGILGYWLSRKYSNKEIPTLLALVSLIIFVGSAYMGFAGNFTNFMFVIMLAVFSRFLFDFTNESSTDKFFGDMAYPIYILQIPLSSMVRSLGYAEATAEQYFVVVISISILILFLFDRPIERFRINLRKKKFVPSNADAM